MPVTSVVNEIDGPSNDTFALNRASSSVPLVMSAAECAWDAAALLLKVVQSAEDKHPACAPLATLQANVRLELKSPPPVSGAVVEIVLVSRTTLVPPCFKVPVVTSMLDDPKVIAGSVPLKLNVKVRVALAPSQSVTLSTKVLGAHVNVRLDDKSPPPDIPAPALIVVDVSAQVGQLTVFTDRLNGLLKVSALSLLLKVVQSALDNAPRLLPEAVGRLNVWVEVALEILKSLPLVPVAKV